jgi:small subunit ribosomal protein S25e
MKDILAKKSSSGKNKKKKWSKSKAKEKLNSAVFWTKAIWDKCSKDIIAKEAYLTPAVIAEKLKVNVSLARAAIKQLLDEGKISHYNDEKHSKFGVYVKSAAFIKEQESKPQVATDAKKGGEKKQQQKK